MHYTNVRHFTIRWPRLAFHARDSLAEDNNREKYGAIRTRLYICRNAFHDWPWFVSIALTTNVQLHSLRKTLAKDNARTFHEATKTSSVLHYLSRNENLNHGRDTCNSNRRTRGVSQRHRSARDRKRERETAPSVAKNAKLSQAPGWPHEQNIGQLNSNPSPARPRLPSTAPRPPSTRTGVPRYHPMSEQCDSFK